MLSASNVAATMTRCCATPSAFSFDSVRSCWCTARSSSLPVTSSGIRGSGRRGPLGARRLPPRSSRSSGRPDAPSRPPDRGSRPPGRAPGPPRSSRRRSPPPRDPEPRRSSPSRRGPPARGPPRRSSPPRGALPPRDGGRPAPLEPPSRRGCRRTVPRAGALGAIAAGLLGHAVISWVLAGRGLAVSCLAVRLSWATTGGRRVSLRTLRGVPGGGWVKRCRAWWGCVG